MSRALVTGCAGFVGRHMRRALLDAGYDVDGFDLHQPAPVAQPGQRETLWPADARDWLRTATNRYDLVVHCAAIVGGRETIEGAPLKVAVDLAIDAEFFGWTLRTRPEHVVYFSSSAVYPIALQTAACGRRLGEDDLDLDRVRNPDQTYGWSKLTGELLARHAQEAGVRVHVFRPFSGYGEDQALDYPFPTFIDRARRREDPFTIWGNGRQVRDWIHIDDICAATLAAVRLDIPGPVNLGTGIGTSMTRLAELATEAAGYAPAFRYRHDMPRGVEYRVAVPDRLLAFHRPKITLTDGVRRALAAAPPLERLST